MVNFDDRKFPINCFKNIVLVWACNAVSSQYQKNKREKVLIGSSCVFNRKFFFLKKGWNHKIKKPSIEHEEFAKRLGPQNITRINNIFVIHKFPKGRKLFSIIFLRSRDWMYSKLNNEVEFDGLSRTKSTGFFSFQPFLFAFSFIISLSISSIFL